MSNNKQVNDFSISGKVIFVGPPEQYTTKSGRTVATRILIMEVFSGDYSDEVAFEFKEKNIGQLNNVFADKWYTVQFRLRGSSWIKDGKKQWRSRNEGLSVLKG